MAKNKTKKFKDTNKFRESHKLDPIRQGKRKCLNCRKKFFSEDVKSERFCKLCKPDHRGIMEHKIVL